MKLHQALHAPLNAGLKAGLLAIKKADARKISVAGAVSITHSIDLDSSLVKQYPEHPRWDYAIGKHIDEDNDEVIYLEIHPAYSSEVDRVLRKLQWLKDWITEGQSELKQIKKSRFVWVASDRIEIPKHTAQWRRLAKSPLGCVQKICSID